MFVKKNITVSELKKQLETLESLGLGEYELWFRPYDSPDYRVEEGVWDTDKESKTVAIA